MMFREDIFSLSDYVAGSVDSTKANTRSFNLVEAVVRGKLHETSHSRILGEILMYDQTILKSFLDTFVRPGLYYKENQWNVFIEKNHIDVTIQGDFNVVIIENKVNNASEQYRQIDRYVEQKYSGGLSNIYVLYLSREYPLLPSEYSFDSSRKNCNLITKTYKKDVRKWIEEILYTKDCGFSIYSALHHYKNYLDCMFESDSDSSVSKETKNQIEKYLTMYGNDDKVASLKNLSDKLYNTAEICKKLMYEEKWAQIMSEIDNRLNGMKLPQLESLKSLDWDLPDAGIEFKLKGRNNRFFAVVSYLRQRYIGIIDLNHTGRLDNEIVDELKTILKPICSDPAVLTEAGIGSTYRYPYWFNVDNDDNLVKRYLQMIEILKENEKVELIYTHECRCAGF